MMWNLQALFDPKYREPVTDVRCTGQLVEWLGQFGWIKPSAPIRHPAGQLNGGLVYVGAGDVQGTPPEQGGLVSFLVYVDMNGLGAAECKSAPNGVCAGGVITPLGGGAPLQGAGPILSAFARKNGLRTRVFPGRVTGKIVEWDGKEGWIQPTEPLQSPDSEEGIMLVALKEEDVLPPGTELGETTTVTFFVFSDNGLDNKVFSAEKCMVYKGTYVGQKKEKELKNQQEGGIVQKPQFKNQQKDGKGKGWNCKGWGMKGCKGGGKGLVPRTPGGPHQPRERITDTPINGTVLRWKGNFGFIRPETPIDHPQAGEPPRGGDLYIHDKDLLEGGQLSAGQMVNFHVYSDVSGLGAEECIVVLESGV